VGAVAIATGEVLQVGLDAVAQLAQLVEGWREGGEWDWNLTRSAAITGVAGGVLGPVFQGVGHYPGKVLGRVLGAVAGKDVGREAGDWAAGVVKGAGHEYVTDGASSLVQGGGWSPDTFSLTAGAVDEGITGLAGMGRRKGGCRFYADALGLGKTPRIDVPDRVAVDPSVGTVVAGSVAGGAVSGGVSAGLFAGGRSPAAGGVSAGGVGEVSAGVVGGVGRESGLGFGSRRWWGSSGVVSQVVQVRRVGSPRVPDLIRFWESGSTHRVAVLDDSAAVLDDSAGVQVVASVGDGAGSAGVVVGVPGGSGTLPGVVDLPGQTASRVGTSLGVRSRPGVEVETRSIRRRLMGADVGAGAADTPSLAPVRRSRQKKLALLADYERAVSQRRGSAWLRDHRINRNRLTEWRRLRETALLPVGDPRLAAAVDFLSLEQQAGLVREYREAVAGGREQAWLAEKNLTKTRMTRWQKVLGSGQQPAVSGSPGVQTELFVDPVGELGPLLLLAVAAEQGASGSDPVSSASRPGPIEVDPGQSFSLDGLDPAPLRRTRQERLALLADYERAVSRQEGRAWLRKHRLNSGRLSQWRRLRETALLPVGDPRLAAAVDFLSLEQQAGLVREYREATAGGRAQEWLAEKNLTRARMTRWESVLGSRQQPTAGSAQQATSQQPAAPGSPGDRTELFVDPVGEFGPLLLLAVAAEQGASGSVSVSPASRPGPIEVGPGQSFTLDDLAPARVRCSRQKELALLADYERAVSRQKGTVWLREHRLNSGRLSQWRRLRETALLPAGDPRLAAAARFLSWEQKAALVREYREATAGGRAQEWLAEKNWTRARMTRWESVLGSRRQPTAGSAQQATSQQPAAPGSPGDRTELFVDPVGELGPLLAAAEQGASGSASASASRLGPIEVDPGQSFSLDDPTPARVRRRRQKKLALLADYERAVSRQKGTVWLREHRINPGRLNEWRRLREAALLPAGDPRPAAAAGRLSREQQVASRSMQQPATLGGSGDQVELFVDPVGELGPLPAAAEQGASGSASASASRLGPIEVDPGQSFSLDDPTPARVRRSRQKKLALLADYEQATSQLKGTAWLRKHRLNPGQISEWRRLRETVELPAGDPRLAAAADFLSRKQRTGLVREYREAVAGGTAQAWLADKHLTKTRMTRWESMLGSRQQPTAGSTQQLTVGPAQQPAVPGGPGDRTELRVDQVGEFGPLAAAAEQGAFGSASASPTSRPGPIEVDPGQSFTLDDPIPARARRSRQERLRLALLADYEQAVSHQKGAVWLREQRINPGQINEWRQLREVAQLPAGHPPAGSSVGRRVPGIERPRGSASSQ
jgi:hypothetical protein